jgi:heme-degrading monooxygenase HmoA
MKAFTLAMMTMALIGCGTAGPDDKVCVRSYTEPDLQVAPLSGPGVDPATGKLAPGTYLLSSTYLRLSTDAAAQKTFQAAFKAISDTLPTQPGLIAWQVATSSECLTARTLSVWKDDASMYGFAGGPAHADAVAKIGTISRGGSVVTHWSGTEADATLDVGIAHVSVAPGSL